VWKTEIPKKSLLVVEQSSRSHGFIRYNWRTYKIIPIIYWKACIEDLWEVVGGSEMIPPEVTIEATVIEPTEDPQNQRETCRDFAKMVN
jgi:hypothetical protein